MENVIHLLIKSNTINFLIVLAIIIFVMLKLNINAKIDNLRDEIKSYVDSSENERKQAKEGLVKINDKISNLPVEMGEIAKSAENSVRSISDRIHFETEDQKNDISKNAKRVFDFETKKFKEKLTNILSEKSIELAKQNALDQLQKNKSLHDKYIENAITELDGIVL